jgi:hypothetical protein
MACRYCNGIERDCVRLTQQAQACEVCVNCLRKEFLFKSEDQEEIARWEREYPDRIWRAGGVAYLANQKP